MALLNRDFKSVTHTPTSKQPRRHWPLLLILSGMLGGAALVGPINFAQATRDAGTADGLSAIPNQRMNLPLPLPARVVRDADAPAVATDNIDWQRMTVKPGDTLSGLFKRMEIGTNQLYALLNADKKAGKLVQTLHPGQTIQYYKDADGLAALKLELNKTETLAYARDGDSYKVNLSQVALESRAQHASGSIESSLFSAGKKAGLPDSIIMQLAGIFGWDVDFALDIRSGDHFNVIYEEFYKDGEKLEDGDILAAEFVNQGQTFRAVRFTDPNGESNYYTPEGYSMRKAFIRSPVDFRRISSTFQTERYHPVLGKKRPHRGVDYAAATGTPIKAAGDGKIIFRGTKGGYGNTVIIQHGGKYTTLYAHMSKFRKGVGVGSRVKQGQIIGYVGMTGLATGPHLHYEFRIDGVHRNPLTVKLPNAEPIKAAYKPAFLSQTQTLLAQLDTYNKTVVALNQ